MATMADRDGVIWLDGELVHTLPRVMLNASLWILQVFALGAHRL